MGNKKGFYGYISSERKTRENEDLLQNGNRDPVTMDKKKAEVLSVFFALVLTGKTGLQESQ